MHIKFSKFQGTGNDFILLDNTKGLYSNLSIDNIIKLCDRRYGIGADGLIKINSSEQFSFEVDYYNRDGSKSFCGNGARCAVSFANLLNIDVSETTFEAFDGIHSASFNGLEVSLQMSDVREVEGFNNDFVVYTGSPHYVSFSNDLSKQNIVSFGKTIRYSEYFKEEGINVNLVQVISKHFLEVLTYERGVEDETFSCGTGVTAVSIAYAFDNDLLGSHILQIKVKGGVLKVAFNQKSKGFFSDIRLIGPAAFVYKGEINV